MVCSLPVGGCFSPDACGFILSRLKPVLQPEALMLCSLPVGGVFNPDALMVCSLPAKAGPTRYGGYRMFYSLGALDVGGSLGPRL